MGKSIQEKFHRQHRQWQDDTVAWRIDIETWRRELRTALAEVQDVLRDSLEALEVHADTVWEGEQRARAHELTLYQETLSGKSRKTDKQWTAAHHKQAALHDHLAGAHARIGRHHRRLVAEAMKLLQRAGAAM